MFCDFASCMSGKKVLLHLLLLGRSFGAKRTGDGSGMRLGMFSIEIVLG